MEYNFKKFDSTGGKYESRISITSSRSIGFPTKFYNENKVGESKFVVLFYDEDKKAIGIKFTKDEEEPHKYTIIKSDHYGGSVVATSFFKKYDLDPKRYKGRYEWKIVETDFGKLFVIELGER